MTISIELFVTIIVATSGSLLGLIGVYVKIQVDNALHKERQMQLKEEIKIMRQRIVDNEEKIEEKIEKILTKLDDLKTQLSKK